MNSRKHAKDIQHALESLRDSSGPISPRADSCPSDGEFAAWFDARLGAYESEAVERHLVSCRFCRGRAGVLSRLGDTWSGAAVSADCRAEAKRRPFGQRKALHRYTTPWAAAALIILTVTAALVFENHSVPIGRSGPVDVEGSERVVRTFAPSGQAPRLVSPRDGSTVTADTLVVDWLAIPGSRHYEVFLLSDAGELLEHRRVVDTPWQADFATALEPGQHYFIRVDADLGPAGVVRSSHSQIFIEEQR